MIKKINILICLFAATIICCAQKNNNSDLPKRAVISGVIQHLELNPSTKEVSVEVRDYRDRNTSFTSTINNDGTFKIELTLYATQDIESSIFGKLLLHPGDSIFVKLDFRDDSYAEFSGDRSIDNTLLHKFLLKNDDETYYTKNKIDIYSYKAYCDSLYERDLAEFDEFSKKEKPSEEVALWIENQMKIKYYGSILSYPNYYFQWYDKGAYTNWVDSTQFLTRVENEFGNYGNVCMNSEFYELFENYFDRKYSSSEGDEVNINLNISESLDTTNFQQIEVAYVNYIALCSGNTGMFDCSIDLSDSTIYMKDIIYSVIKQPFIRQPLFDFYNVIKSNTDNPHYATDAVLEKMDVQGRDFLDSIISSNKGKVLFVDLWATWCGPCLEGMKASKDIMPGYADKDVEFIFICVSSNKDAWKSTLSKLRIGGKHYFCNEIQSTDIRNALNVKGVPHYLLINKQGNIVDPDCLDLKQSRDRIDKLLNN